MTGLLLFGRLRMFGVVFAEPFLEVPQLSASASDVVLSSGIEDPCMEADIVHLGVEVFDYVELALY